MQSSDFSSWNPQWLLMLVPFLVLNIFMNENGNLLVMVTNVLIVALYIFCSQNLVDEQIMELRNSEIHPSGTAVCGENVGSVYVP